MPYIKCENCLAEVATQYLFKNKLETGEWFVGRDSKEIYYDYKHDCSK